MSGVEASLQQWLNMSADRQPWDCIGLQNEKICSCHLISPSFHFLTQKTEDKNRLFQGVVLRVK